MVTTSAIEQIDQFRKFVLARLSTGDASQSLDELFDEWRFAEPLPRELELNAKAIEASLRDLDSGHEGIALKDFVKEFKSSRDLR